MTYHCKNNRLTMYAFVFVALFLLETISNVLKDITYWVRLDWKICACIYTTKGRDRFHWAATPLKPHKVGNICYMTYRYSVLYFLNLSLNNFFPTENGNFCENIQIRRPLSFYVLTCRACPIDVLPNRR